MVIGGIKCVFAFVDAPAGFVRVRQGMKRNTCMLLGFQTLQVHYVSSWLKAIQLDTHMC